jgi:hypothetical protein
MHHAKSNREDRGGLGVARDVVADNKHRRPPTTHGLWRVVKVDKNPEQEHSYWSVFIDQCNNRERSKVGRALSGVKLGPRT